MKNIDINCKANKFKYCKKNCVYETLRVAGSIPALDRMGFKCCCSLVCLNVCL